MNSLSDVGGIRVGHYQRLDPDASLGAGWASGVTVVLTPPGTVGAVDCRGGAPGTRETDLLDPANTVRFVDAVLLAGGSAYGLAAADGVMRWLEEHDRGVAMEGGVVPIVPGAVIFDLPVGGWDCRPTAEFGYAACAAAGASAGGGTSTAPVANANTVSPSSGVCAGRMVRAKPSWAAIAMRRQAAELSAASVATTATVVLSGSSEERSCASASIWSAGGRVSANSSIRSAIHGRPVARSTTSPAEFTATNAPTVTPEGSVVDAVPIPPLSTPARAPTPAPTVPTAVSAPAASQAA